MRIFNRVLYLTSLVTFVILVILSIAAYSKYGNGLGYFIFIIFPLIYITIGLSATLISKWWLVLLSVSVLTLCYVCWESASNFSGFILPFVCYILVSVIIGCNSRIVVKNKLKMAKEDKVIE